MGLVQYNTYTTASEVDAFIENRVLSIWGEYLIV